MSESLRLTGQQLKILREGILGAYREPDALKILLAEEMEVQIGIIAQGDAYITKVFNLIQEFEGNGRISEFIQVIVKNNPNSPYIKDIIENFPSLFIQVSPLPEENPKIKQFREKVKECLSDRILEDKERALLVIYRNKLGLSAEQADRVVEEELALIEQARQAYKDMLEDLIEFYPFDESIKRALKEFQLDHNLTDEEVEKISQSILERAEINYQKKQQEKAKELIILTLGISLERFEFDVIRVDKKGEENSRTRKSALFFIEDLGNGIGLEMVYIPAGTYLMGSPEGKGYDREHPQHSVSVPPYLMGKYQITQAQWRIVAAYPPEARELNPNPANFPGDNRPVEQVSWEDAKEFCSRLSRKTGREYRLPSEAEWEYACRGGTTTEFYFGDTITPNLARFNATETAPVGSYPPNAFGLYDMHGNIWEWCEDEWHSSYEGNPPVDGSAWKSTEGNNAKVLRGGSWLSNSDRCRSADRIFGGRDVRLSDYGFRVVCEVGRTL
jgi:formylglycine-generating enzyme required for sulfatase activity